MGAERIAEVKAGDWLHDKHGNIRVMAIANGYAMCRRPHAVPFVVRLRDLYKGCARVHYTATPIQFGRALSQKESSNA